ncbi:hypothetical protein [Plantactinospora endophytica]|uniref:Nucleotidyltransferase n=1 Tax=Plantactinospora endophytica TaxID=673535 RepID=A0ABQ4EF19_9ACTN|nr:hypothetical protein [Plantactinospora endophytica]GIG93311.1 hypothetical protein Pen02_82470 [Plantactinospora endophytica]
MTGPMIDPRYVAARRVLLNALDALAKHRPAVILAGAQAIYVRTGAADLDVSVAPHTLDADLALDSRILGSDPRLEQAMQEAGFHLANEPGTWIMQTTANGEPVHVPVDLLVPAVLAGRGRRAAELPDHGPKAARRTPGLEAALADHDDTLISSLEPEVDARTAVVPVAGAAALFVAKAHKLHERLDDMRAGRTHRLKPKDASDVFRLMQAEPADRVGQRLREIASDEMAGESVRAGVQHLQTLFGRESSPGVNLAAQALAGAIPEQRVRTLSRAYMAALTASYQAG